MPIAIGPMPAGIYRGDSCSRCARADNCYDTEVEIKYEGSVALCRGCIGDLALAAGFDIDGTKLREAEAARAAAVAEAAESKRLLAAVRQALRKVASQ